MTLRRRMNPNHLLGLFEKAAGAGAEGLRPDATIGR